ncbi:ribonuclease H-like domain-containing protein [Tanacetum coccineum]
MLYDVLVVHDYCVSLLSVNKLIKDSNSFVGFDEDKCYVHDFKRETTLGIGSESGGLYPFALDSDRLGHSTDQVLVVLKKELNMSKSFSVSSCEVCHRAKQTKEPFPLIDNKSKSLGELVHLDLWGPYRVTNREGFRATLVVDGSPLFSRTDAIPSLLYENRTATQVEEISISEGNVYESPIGSSSIPTHRLISNHIDSLQTESRRTSSVSKLPAKLNNYVIDSKLRCGLEKHVYYVKLNYVNYCFATTLKKSIEPTTYYEYALNRTWIEAMNDEIVALYKNNTWTITDLPKGRKAIGCKWTYKIKYKASGERFDSTGVTGVTLVLITITTPMCKPSKVNNKTSDVTVGPDVARNIGARSCVNVINPHTASLHSTNPIQSSIHNVIKTGPILYINIVSPTSPGLNVNANKNRGRKVGNELVNEFPSSYATKLSPTSSIMANLRKLEASVPKVADYYVWLPLALVHEFSSKEGVDFVLQDGPWMIRGIPIFLNKWSPSVSLLKEELSCVPVCTCLLYGHKLVDCPKADPKRVVNGMDKGKGQTFRAEDDGFIEVKKKKSRGNNGGNKNFKPVSVKPKTFYRPKTKQSNKGTSNSPKTTPFAGTNKDGKSCTPLVERIDVLEKQLLEDKHVLVDDDRKPLEMVAYPGVGYGPRILLEQLRDTVVDDEYDSYDDDMYEGFAYAEYGAWFLESERESERERREGKINLFLLATLGRCDVVLIGWLLLIISWCADYWLLVCGLREMESGFLLGKNASMKKVFVTMMASNVKNIDCKLLAKDGKPIKAHYCTSHDDASMGHSESMKDNDGSCTNVAGVMVEMEQPDTTCPMVLGSYQLGTRGRVMNEAVNFCLGMSKPGSSASYLGSIPTSVVDKSPDSTRSDICYTKNIDDAAFAYPLYRGNPLPKQNDNVNLETPLEFHKGNDVNSNSNVEPTASASLSAYINEDDVAAPLESIRVVSERFAIWLMVSFWKFCSKDGLDAMLENGPCFIGNNPLILKRCDPDVNLLKEDVGNIPVWVILHGVPITAFSEDGLSVIVTKLGTLLMLDSYTSDMCIHSWGRSSYARAMIELRADVELKDTIMVAMPKFVGEGFYMCTIHVEYELKPPKYSSCKVFGHILNECPKKIVSDVNPRQDTRGVSVGPNVIFKLTKQIYKPISNKNGVGTSGNKMQAKVTRQEVSNSNLFDTVNSIENDDDLGTNGGISKSAGKGSLNVAHDSSTNTAIREKIDKIKR